MDTTPVNLVAPTISGTAKQGETLTASAGTWLGVSGALTYQWRRCDAAGESCAALAATATSYKLVAEDVGRTIRVAVSAANAHGKTTAVSAPTTVVLTAGPINTVLPAIAGTAKQGQTLTASAGTWTQSPTSFAYGWQRCDAAGANCALLAAHATTYKLVAEDVGKTLRVAVTAINAFNSTTALSAQTAVVLTAAPVNTSLPTIAGVTKKGQVLSASSGSWANLPTPIGTTGSGAPRRAAPSPARRPRATRSPRPTSARPSVSSSPPSTCTARPARRALRRRP